MDWPDDEPSFTENALCDFIDDSRESTVVLHSYGSQDLTKWELDSDEKWRDWLVQDHFELHRQPRPGLGVILAARKEEDRHDPATILNLPFSSDVFEAIAADLPLHRETTKVMLNIYDITFAIIDSSKSEWNRIFYCFRSSTLHMGDLAVSSVFYPSSGFTAAVVFGCNQKHREEIVKRITASMSKNWTSHPLLIMGIVAELERERHHKLVREQVGKLIQRMLDLSNHEQISTTSKMKKDYYGVGSWIDLNQLRSELQRCKIHLARMMEHIDELDGIIAADAEKLDNNAPIDPSEANWRHACAETGRRMKSRLREIMHNYDTDIRECTMAVDGLALATQMSWNQISYQDTQTNLRIASDTKYDSSSMKIIATLTMIFLPATFVSSVFSMSFFDWDPPEGKQIVSPYAWIYPVIVAAITIIVVGAWYPFVRNVRAKHSYIQPSV